MNKNVKFNKNLSFKTSGSDAELVVATDQAVKNLYLSKNTFFKTNIDDNQRTFMSAYDGYFAVYLKMTDILFQIVREQNILRIIFRNNLKIKPQAPSDTKENRAKLIKYYEECYGQLASDRLKLMYINRLSIPVMPIKQNIDKCHSGSAPVKPNSLYGKMLQIMNTLKVSDDNNTVQESNTSKSKLTHSQTMLTKP